MAKDKEVIVVEYDLRTVGAEKTKKELKDIERIRERSIKGRTNLIAKEIESTSEYKKIQKKRISDERKALSQEKNLANQRIQLARNTAKRVIRAIPKSPTRGWNDPHMPSQTPAERVSFRRRRTRSQIQKDIRTDRFMSKFKNVGQVRPMYGPSNMYRQNLGFKIPRPSKLPYMTIGGNRMMQGPQFGATSARMTQSYNPETMYSRSGRVNFASRFAHTGATRLMQGAEYRPFDIGPKTGAVSDRGLSRAEIIRANIAESRRARQASNFGGPVKYGADYQQRQMQRASMDWMKSKTSWTPDKQKKMSKWLKAEADAKEKLLKAEEKSKRDSKTKPKSVAKAMERTMLYGGFGMMASYMLRSIITSGLAVGDAFAGVEMEQRKGSALGRMYGGKESEAVRRYSALTGEGDYMSKSVLAQIASPLQAQGKGLSSKGLESVADVLFGMQYGMGKTRESSISGLINVLSGKGTLKEAGFAGVKKGSSAETTLENILKFLKTNELTKSIMQERSITASMGRVRSAPKSMLAEMLDRAPSQMNRSFENMALASEDFFNQEYWGRTMANFELFSKALKDNAGAIGKFGAQVVGLGLKGATAVMDDPKGTILPAIGAKMSYSIARKMGMPTLKRWFNPAKGGQLGGGLLGGTLAGLFLNSTETGMGADLGNQPGAVDWSSLRKNNSINSMGQPIYIENAYFDENGQLSQDIRHWGGN